MHYRACPAVHELSHEVLSSCTSCGFACFPAATHLFISPCLRASARSRGRIKQYFLFVAALVLPPAFLAVMIFTVISDRYPRPDITVFFISLRAAVYCGGHVTLSRDPLYLADPMIVLGRVGFVRHLSPPCNLNPATVFAVKCTRSAPTSRGRW